MFEDLDRDDVANLAKIVGIIVFIVSFFLPAVTTGYVHSPADHHMTNNVTKGWECAEFTLFGTVELFARDPSSGWVDVFYMVSGWISPLVLIFAIFPDRSNAKRMVAKALPFLLVVPLLFFASATTERWSPGPFRPLIGHYVWTVGCLLIFTPQYARMLGLISRESNEAPDED